MRIIALLAAACIAAGAAPVSGQTAPEHEVTEQSVVWAVPGIERVTVRRDVPFKAEGGASLRLDLYLPADFHEGTTRPAVVFVNGVGADQAGRSLGQTDRALDALEKAVASGFRDRGLAERDDDLASLRGTERFQRLLARIGAS